MEVCLPYGNKAISFNVPEKNFIGMMDPPFVEPIINLEGAISKAIDNPIGSPALKDIIRPGEKIAFIVDDCSRPTPISTILPILLKQLESTGVRKKDIKIVIALGSHRYMTEKELEERVGKDVYANYKVCNSEFKKPEGLVYVGDTSEGIPITITKEVMDTGIHIGVGCLAPHPVMGWGGGGKILFPGIAGERTVAYFHLKASLYDENFFGNDTTPVRNMMESWVDSIGLHFIVNVVLNSKMQIAAVVAGDYVKAHREGVRKGKKILGYKVNEKADIMIVSSHPADQDFWQSPKGFYAAEGAMSSPSGGTMILVSPNYEGIGPHKEFPECMIRDDGDDIVIGCIRGEDHGDPLAVAIGNSMSKMRRRRRLIVVSDGVSEEEMKRCGCEHCNTENIQRLIDNLIAETPDCRMGALSNGAETFLYE